MLVASTSSGVGVVRSRGASLQKPVAGSAEALEQVDGTAGTESSVVDRPSPPMDAAAADLLAYPWRGVTPKRVLHRLTAMPRSGEREQLLNTLSAPGSARWIAFQALTRPDDQGGIPRPRASSEVVRPAVSVPRLSGICKGYTVRKVRLVRSMRRVSRGP